MNDSDFQKYVLGHPDLDHEHRQLFLLMERVGHACTKREAEDVLQALTDYAVGHFYEEEQLMQLYGYPEMEQHLGQHEAFRKDIQGHVAEFNADNSKAEAICAELARILPTWLMQHIDRTDRKLVAYVDEKGPVGSEA